VAKGDHTAAWIGGGAVIVAALIGALATLGSDGNGGDSPAPPTTLSPTASSASEPPPPTSTATTQPLKRDLLPDLGLGLGVVLECPESKTSPVRFEDPRPIEPFEALELDCGGGVAANEEVSGVEISGVRAGGAIDPLRPDFVRVAKVSIHGAG